MTGAWRRLLLLGGLRAAQRGLDLGVGREVERRLLVLVPRARVGPVLEEPLTVCVRASEVERRSRRATPASQPAGRDAERGSRRRPWHTATTFGTQRREAILLPRTRHTSARRVVVSFFSRGSSDGSSEWLGEGSCEGGGRGDRRSRDKRYCGTHRRLHRRQAAGSRTRRHARNGRVTAVSSPRVSRHRHVTPRRQVGRRRHGPAVSPLSHRRVTAASHLNDEREAARGRGV